MQIKSLPQSLYKINSLALTQTIKSDEIKKRKKFLGDWKILKARKVPDKAKISGIR